MMKHEIITLCGSTRFQDEFDRTNRELTLAGKVVLSCGVFGKGRDADVFEGAGVIEAAATRRILDGIHAEKIAMSDAIYVVNPGGYIGESTWREIAYAGMLRKRVYSFERISHEEVIARMDEEAHLAERYAAWQLDVIAHNPDGLGGAEASFMHKGVEVFDPWIRETQQGEPWAWMKHREPGFQISPQKHYGKKKYARFVFDAMRAMAEYRTAVGCDLCLPEYGMGD